MADPVPEPVAPSPFRLLIGVAKRVADGPASTVSATAVVAAAPPGAEPTGRHRRDRRGSKIPQGLAADVRPVPDPAATLAAGAGADAIAGVTSVPVTEAPAAADAQPPPEDYDNTGLHKLVARLAGEFGVPFALADAVIRIESRYAARTVHAGNYGLMQIRAQTARGLGFSGNVVGLLNPETNLRYGLKYLAEAYRLGNGDTCLTVMRYQSGLGATHLSAANRAYCAKARALSAGL